MNPPPPPWRAALASAALPGAWLIAGGRPLAGLAGLLPCLIGAGALIAAPAIADPDAAGGWRALGGALIAGAAIWAGAAGWRIAARRRIDPAAVRAAHDRAAAAYLRGEWPAALAAARQVAALAPDEPGAWLLLAEIQTAAGDAPAGERSRRRAAAAGRRS